MTRTTQSPPGFTLLELLVVIAIIGVLAALAIPIISKVGKRAGTTETAANARQLFILFSSYQGENNGQWPIPREGGSGPFWNRDKLFPYLINQNTETPSWQAMEGSIFTSPNAPPIGQRDNPAAPDVANPSNQGFGMNVYLPSPDGDPYQAGTPEPQQRRVNPLLSKDPAQQMLLMECNAPIIFGAPFFVAQFTTFVKNRHDGRNTVLFCDGHVELIEHERFDANHPNPLFPWHATEGTPASKFWRGL